MADITGHFRSLRRSNHALVGLVAALRQNLARLSRRRAKPLHFDAWPDYLLRDVGLSRTELDPHRRSVDWLGR